MQKLILFLFLIVPFGLKAQADLTTFKSEKVSITNRGDNRVRGQFNESTILLNLRDLVITVEQSNPDVISFLEGKTTFQIEHNIGGSPRILQFITEDDFVFSFYFRQRVIIVGKKNLSTQMHALRFEEIRQ